MAVNQYQLVVTIRKNALTRLKEITETPCWTEDAAQTAALIMGTQVAILEYLDDAPLDWCDVDEGCSDDFICDECAAADADDAKAELDAVIDSILNRGPIAPYPSTSYGRNSIFSQPFINDMPPVIICGCGFSEN